MVGGVLIGSETDTAVAAGGIAIGDIEGDDLPLGGGGERDVALLLGAVLALEDEREISSQAGRLSEALLVSGAERSRTRRRVS